MSLRSFCLALPFGTSGWCGGPLTRGGGRSSRIGVRSVPQCGTARVKGFRNAGPACDSWVAAADVDQCEDTMAEVAVPGKRFAALGSGCATTDLSDSRTCG